MGLLILILFWVIIYGLYRYLTNIGRAVWFFRFVQGVAGALLVWDIIERKWVAAVFDIVCFLIIEYGIRRQRIADAKVREEREIMRLRGKYVDNVITVESVEKLYNKKENEDG